MIEEKDGWFVVNVKDARNITQRFLREAQMAAALEHPNVVQVYDVGQEDGLYYISMQYIDGLSLESLPIVAHLRLAQDDARQWQRRFRPAQESRQTTRQDVPMLGESRHLVQEQRDFRLHLDRVLLDSPARRIPG